MIAARGVWIWCWIALAAGAAGCGEKSEPEVPAAPGARPPLLVLETRPGLIAEPVGAKLVLSAGGRARVCLDKRLRSGERAYELQVPAKRLARIKADLEKIDLTGLPKGRPVPDRGSDTLTAKGTTVSSDDTEFSEELEQFIFDRLEPLMVYTRRDRPPKGARKTDRRC